MRELVLWADDTSSNLGVRALTTGTAALVQRAYPGAEVTFLSYGNEVAPVRAHACGSVAGAQRRLRELTL